MKTAGVTGPRHDALKELRFRILQRSQPALALIGLAGAVTALHFAVRWQIPLPFCALRRWTGVPCPACGSTRSLLAWSELELGQAWLFNPLFFLACLMVVMWALLWFTEKLSGGNWLASLENALQRLFTWKLVLVLAGLNWLYLCLALPK